MEKSSASFKDLCPDEQNSILKFLDLESLYQFQFVDTYNLGAINSYSKAFVKKCVTNEGLDTISIDAFRWAVNNIPLEDLDLTLILEDENYTRYFLSEAAEFINAMLPSIKRLNLREIDIIPQQFNCILEYCSNLEYIDCTFCQKISYEQVLYLKYKLPNCTIRRLPSWLTGDVKVPWTDDEIHKYYIDGSFVFTRNMQARGFVNKIGKCRDCVRDYIQYVDYPFPPWQCWNDRAGVLAKQHGYDTIVIAQISQNVTTDDETCFPELAHPSTFPRIDYMPVTGKRDEDPPEELVKEIYRWFFLNYTQSRNSPASFPYKLYDITSCPRTVFEQANALNLDDSLRQWGNNSKDKYNVGLICLAMGI